MKNKLLKRILVYGLTAGLIQVLCGIIMYYAGIYFKSWSILISAAVLVVFIYATIKDYSAKSGISAYWKLVIPGTVVGLLCGVIYSIYNLISIKYFYPEFIDEAISALFLKRSIGLRGDQLEILNNELHTDLTLGSIAFSNLLLLSLIGLVSSLIISVFIKRKPK